MRDRYYIRINKVLKPYTKVTEEWRRHQWQLRREHIKLHPQDTTVGNWFSYESACKWFLEKHNIVLSQNSNGIMKLGFATPADVTLFTLRNS